MLSAKLTLIVDKPSVCQRICPTACKSDDLRPAVGTGMHFYVSHRPTLRLRGVQCLRTSCARHFSPSGLHLLASVCSAKNARNDVHAVISDESLVLPRLCQYSVSAKLTVGLPFPQESHEAPSLSRFPLNLAKIGSFYIYFDLAAVLPSFFSASSRRLWMRSSG